MKKSVLVTGGTGAIGEAICRRFAAGGYFVGVHCRAKKEKAEKLAKELGGVALCFDVSREEETKAGIEGFCRAAGGISSLVNNAGIALPVKMFLDTTEEEFDRVFSVDVKGVYFAMKHAVPHMLERGGSVINVSSMWGLCGGSCEALYSAAKAAVIGLTKAAAKEVSSCGVRVNCVAPGYIDTPMNGWMSREERKSLEEEIPLGRAGQAEEIAEAVFFLAESGGYITGETLNVSGGFVI